jgi:hypothetical protein
VILRLGIPLALPSAKLIQKGDHMFKPTAILILLSLIFSISSLADNTPVKVDTSMGQAYIPDGFDDNDNVQIVGAGVFPNSCYRPADPDVQVNIEKKEITLTPKAYMYNGYCLQVLLPFEMTFNLGPLKAGTYSIKKLGGTALGELVVRTSLTPDADDYMYAPIGQAFFNSTPEANTVILTGQFPLSCMKIKEIKSQVQPNVLVIQPIVEIDHDMNCEKGQFDFKVSEDLGPIKHGKYLLHIRSMNGKSVNSLINVP